jgi:hypothetical protein
MDENSKNKIIPWEEIPQKIKEALVDVAQVADDLPVWECRNLITEEDLERITPLLEEYFSLINEQGQDEEGEEVQKIVRQLKHIFLNKGVVPAVSDDLASLQFR